MHACAVCNAHDFCHASRRQNTAASKLRPCSRAPPTNAPILICTRAKRSAMRHAPFTYTFWMTTTTTPRTTRRRRGTLLSARRKMYRGPVHGSQNPRTYALRTPMIYMDIHVHDAMGAIRNPMQLMHVCIHNLTGAHHPTPRTENERA